MRRRRQSAVKRVRDQLVRICGRDAVENRVVHHHRRSGVASSQTRDVSNVDAFFTRVAWCAGEARLETLEQSRAAVQMAAHVTADAHFSARGRLQIEMRVEARDTLPL